MEAGSLGKMMSWKVLVGPGLLLGLKFAKVQYDDPFNLLIIRLVYGVSQGFLFALCAYIYLAIDQRGDEQKSVKIVNHPATTIPDEGPKLSTLTYKEYDLAELTKLIKNFVLGAAVTVGIHYYMAVVPALLLQIVTQPVTLMEHPLFSIYVLDKDASKHEKLKRPFTDNSPAARLEAMKKAALVQQHLQESPRVEENGAESSTISKTSENACTGGNAQIILSTAERRFSAPIPGSSVGEM